MPNAPGSILIVEDESIIALDLRETLTAHGYRIVGSVASGEEALRVATETRPDLILMDIRLAGPMTGLEAAQLIRQRLGIPSLFLTSHAEKEQLEQAKSSHALGYLLKPFAERELAINIDMALSHARREQQLRRTLSDAAGERQVVEKLGPEGTASDTLRICTLGGLTLTLGEVTLRSEDFSPTQRELLALLLAGNNARISREEVEVTFWPESTSEKARSSFDSLLMRLRKTMHKDLSVKAARDFLVFQKGILALEGCQVDAFLFIRQANFALQCYKERQPWAEREMLLALSLWHGDFIPEVTGCDRVEIFRRELRNLFLDCCRKQARNENLKGSCTQAIELLRRAILADPGNDDLVGELYQLLAASSPLQAKQLLQDYARQLEEAGFSPKEIAASLRELEGSSP